MDTHAKALAINLDPTSYGSFAEIGAGQEVARWFLTVGAASGTVAETISAYDKTFSDATYGAGTRYVSRERILAMLDREYGLLIERLGPVHGDSTRFFAFADTASARNYKGDNEQHAWVGLRFQHVIGAEPSTILLHVHFLDPTAAMQQAALGVLGVNLIDAALKRWADRDEFLAGLWDGLGIERMEVDVIDVRGPAFEGADVVRWNLQLLRRGMSHAVVLDGHGAVEEPATLLRKRPLVIDRGFFADLPPFHERMLDAAERRLRSEGVPLPREPLRVLEVTICPADGAQPLTDDDVLERVGRMNLLGPVIVSDFSEVFQLAVYLRRFTAEEIRFAMGVSLLALILEERFYTELPGSLLEGLGKLLAQGVKLYAFPMPRELVLRALSEHAPHYQVDEGTDGMVSADEIHPCPPVDHLFAYLRAAGWVVPLDAPVKTEAS